MNVLILGSGGREHALAWKIAQSPDCENLYVAPGNAGTANLGTNLNIDPEDFYSIAEAIEKYTIRLLVVGPEAPLVKGIRNYFEGANDFNELIIVGPDKHGAKLEGSKDFAKSFMQRHSIPTASYATFGRGEVEEAKNFLRSADAPYVLKADGLAGGKGVLILNSLKDAEEEISLMLDEGKFGAASEKVVIESYLNGIEMSVFALTDGTSYLMLPSAKDYKRIGEADTGLNTGGMGAVSPVPFADAELMKKVETRIVKPTIEGLRKEEIDYIGFLFFGLMIVEGDPFVIEYNVRMGDPETEVVLPRIKSDLLSHLVAAGKRQLTNEEIEIDDRFAATVMMVSGGYPGSYEKGMKITGLREFDQSILFHAGTKLHEEKGVITSGGRVLASTGYGNSLDEALAHAYERANAISFEGKYFRKDIGFDLK